MTFENDYFEKVYNAQYDKRNPDYKFKAYLRTILKYKRGGQLLDIGCAYGSFLKIAKSTFEVYGRDISKHAIKIAKQRQPELDFSISDIHNLPENFKYDVITCFDIIEHVEEIDAGINRLKKMLKSDGILVITVPVYDTFVGKIVKYLDKDPTHIHKNSRYWWLSLFTKNKFDILSWQGIWRYYFTNIYYLHCQSSFAMNFAPAIILVVSPNYRLGKEWPILTLEKSQRIE